MSLAIAWKSLIDASAVVAQRIGASTDASRLHRRIDHRAGIALALVVALAGHGAVGLDAVAADILIGRLRRNDDVEILGVVLSARGGIGAGVGLSDTVVAKVAEATCDAHLINLVQRLTRGYVHSDVDQVLLDAGFRRLEHLDLAHQLRRQQRVIEGTCREVGHAPVGGGDGLAAEQGAGQGQVGTENGYLLILAVSAVYAHAGG